MVATGPMGLFDATLFPGWKDGRVKGEVPRREERRAKGSKKN